VVSHSYKRQYILAGWFDLRLSIDYSGRGAVYFNSICNPAGGNNDHVFVLIPGEFTFGIYVPDNQYAAKHSVSDTAQSLKILSGNYKRDILKRHRYPDSLAADFSFIGYWHKRYFS
jgi:hypothetical protein